MSLFSIYVVGSLFKDTIYVYFSSRDKYPTLNTSNVRITFLICTWAPIFYSGVTLSFSLLTLFVISFFFIKGLKEICLVFMVFFFFLGVNKSNKGFENI